MTLTDEQTELYIAKAKEHRFSIDNLTENEMIMMSAIAHFWNTPGLAKPVPVRTPEGEMILRQRLKGDAREDAEARRYLIVNGLIPVTTENVAGIKEFYIDADKLPKGIADELVAWAEKNRNEDAVCYDEDEEASMDSSKPFELKGVWIKDGTINEFTVVREESHTVSSKYYVAMPDAEARKII